MINDKHVNASLADELVATGMVSEGRREELAHYLACRERFLDYTGKKNQAKGPFVRYAHEVIRLGEKTEEACRMLRMRRKSLSERVLADLEVLLGRDAEALGRVEAALGELLELALPGEALAHEVQAMGRTLQCLDHISKLLRQAREGLVGKEAKLQTRRLQ